MWLGHFLYLKLRVAAMADDDDALREIAAHLAAHANPAEQPVFLRKRAVLPARLAEADARWDDAARLYVAALADEPGLDLYSQAHEVRLRAARALVQLGRLAEAAALLQPVFERAAVGEVAGAWFAGPRALAALASAPWGAQLAAAQVAALKAWSARPTAPAGSAPQPHPAPRTAPIVAGAPAAPSAPQTASLLSAREREVLARIAAGDSNKLIARAFDLSPHTVKRHVANILDKIGLHSRGQAAAWHRANE